MKLGKTFTLAVAGACSLALSACGSEAEGDGTIETAAEDDNSLAGAIGADSRFGQAVDAAGLADVLAGPGPYTVLAPTDAAFDALPDGSLDALMAADAKEQLGQVLTYHVLPGTILAEDLVNATGEDGSTEVPTMGGATLAARADEGGVVFIDAAGGEAKVTETIEAENGVVHRLDAVLMPN